MSSYLKSKSGPYLITDSHFLRTNQYRPPQAVAETTLGPPNLWAVFIFLFSVFRLARFVYTQSRPIPHWRVVMVTMLSIAALLQMAPVLAAVSYTLYVGGRPSRLGQEVMADNQNSGMDWPIFSTRGLLRFWSLLPYLLQLACDLLQTLVFTIAMLQSARYLPRDQRVFYWIARVEYTSVGILAIWDLLYYCSRSPFKRLPVLEAIEFSMSIGHVILTSILLAASIRLIIKSNSEREESKVRTISTLSAVYPHSVKETSDFPCSIGTELVSGRYHGSLRPKRD